MAESLSDALSLLRVAYGSRLPGKLDELQSALDSARGGEPGARDRALRLAHKLHGTAGSYGFAEVSAAAGEIEHELGRATSAGDEPDWAAVDAAMRRARDGSG